MLRVHHGNNEEKALRQASTSNCPVLRALQNGGILSHINHSRSYFKLIDNLKRERLKNSKNEEFQHPTKDSPSSLKYGNRLRSVQLNEDYWERIEILFAGIPRYFELSGEYASSIIDGSAKQRKRITTQRSKVEEDMVKAAKSLFAVDLIERAKGRPSNLQAYIDTLKFVLEKNDCLEVWELLSLQVFPKAMEELGEVMINKQDTHV